MAEIQITFVGTYSEATVAGRIGDTVMDAAVDHGVDGIVAQCGGGCTCCTCHCYVPATSASLFPPPGKDESELLPFAWEVRENSRLACQLVLSAEHEGLIIEVPERQA